MGLFESATCSRAQISSDAQETRARRHEEPLRPGISGTTSQLRDDSLGSGVDAQPGLGHESVRSFNHPSCSAGRSRRSWSPRPRGSQSECPADLPCWHPWACLALCSLRGLPAVQLPAVLGSPSAPHFPASPGPPPHLFCLIAPWCLCHRVNEVSQVNVALLVPRASRVPVASPALPALMVPK